jgi:hypothetical protein
MQKWKWSIAAAKWSVPSPQDRKSLHSHNGIVSVLLVMGAGLGTDCNSKPFQSTYYDAQMRASPALLRARAPYLIKNTITGFVICSLVIGICMLPSSNL